MSSATEVSGDEYGGEGEEEGAGPPPAKRKVNSS